MKTTLRAYAKINLGLDVLGKRSDGYHEVRMIMQTVSLYDKLELCDVPEDRVTLECNLPFLPCDSSNLCCRAAAMLREEFGLDRGVHMALEKSIPVAAGLAGGSTDAAAVLVGMNRIFSLGLSAGELMERGKKLGADVPYCIMRGTALSEGIGEVLTPLPPLPHCYIVLVKPRIGISTKFVYENLRITEDMSHPDIDGMTQALRDGDIKGVAGRLSNVLETVAIKEYPIVGEIKTALMEQGALGSLMSGSGSTVFAIFGDEEAAHKAASRIRTFNEVKNVFVRKPFNTNTAY